MRYFTTFETVGRLIFHTICCICVIFVSLFRERLTIIKKMKLLLSGRKKQINQQRAEYGRFECYFVISMRDYAAFLSIIYCICCIC